MKYSPCHPFKSEEAKSEYFNFLEKKEKRWPVDSENHMVKISFGETFVRVSGPVNAPPFVLLPGAGATLASDTTLVINRDHRTQRFGFIIFCPDELHARITGSILECIIL